uniref:Ubiquinol-cytochrome c reductase complex assembly factor 4 n=1 Tax=Cynoglossus semilaevis TaxID=244447 RepID=A0A3P8VX52_CYNSE
MFTAVRRTFFGATRECPSRKILIQNSTLRLNHLKSLALSSSSAARSKRATNDEENNEPIKFSTSKASHRNWKVDRSIGTHYKRPLWKVVPLSLLFVVTLLWCAFRRETDTDAQLMTPLHEHFPTLTKEVEQDNKSS